MSIYTPKLFFFVTIARDLPFFVFAINEKHFCIEYHFRILIEQLPFGKITGDKIVYLVRARPLPLSLRYQKNLTSYPLNKDVPNTR